MHNMTFLSLAMIEQLDLFPNSDVPRTYDLWVSSPRATGRVTVETRLPYRDTIVIETPPIWKRGKGWNWGRFMREFEIGTWERIE